jgi:hypothetical protein
MIFESTRVSVAGLAIAVLSFAAPARAQHVTFTDVRDAVPLKFFNPSSDSTHVSPEAPNTLEIGFESGRDSGLDDEFRASTEAFGNRVAMDTLSFNVVAPEGYYVSSITYHQSGTGAVNTPGDARAASSWVVNGQPADLGSFSPSQFPWSNSQTATFTDSSLTVVPVSLTTELYAFAAPSLASAAVEFTRATIVVTVAPRPTVLFDRN